MRTLAIVWSYLFVLILVVLIPIAIVLLSLKGTWAVTKEEAANFLSKAK
jgi:hypothetical protein